MSPDGVIRWEREGLVGLALIDRPERRNSLNAALCEALRSRLESNRDLRAVVIGGTGEKAFSAGADLAQRAKDVEGKPRGAQDGFRLAFEALLDAIVAFPAPIIAAVNGVALGAGMQLAVACDLRVAAPNASFGIPAAKLSLVVSAINVQRLVQAVGSTVARDVLFTARVLTRDEARDAGLVQRSADDAVAAARDLAKEVATLAPLSMAGHKAMLRRVAETGGLSDLDREELSGYEASAFGSDDLREGLQAFAARRPARFTGR